MNYFSTAIALLFASLLVGCSTGDKQEVDAQTLVGAPSEPPASTGNLWYRIEFDDDSLDVRVRLLDPPGTTRFFLPGRWAGRDDYDASIRLVGARTSEGPTEFAMTRSKGEVEIAAPRGGWVELHYVVDLSARSDFHAQLDRGVLVAFAPTVLVMPAREILQRTRDVPIEVVLPENWTAVSTWPLVETAPSRAVPQSRVHGFLAADVEQLRDAFLVAGPTLRTQRRDEGEDLVEIAYGPAFEGDVARFTDLIESTVAHYRSTYGHAGPVHVYVRTRDATAESMDGVGRRSGFLLDVPPDAAVEPETRLLVAHEALHVWNGHRLIPEPGAEKRTRWFKEGVTHYLALKSLARRGAVDLSFVIDEIASSSAKYHRNPVRRGERGTAIDRRRFPYDFGLLVGLAIDAALLDGSAGDTGVEAWIVELMRDDTRRYEESDLLSALLAVTETPATDGIRSVWRTYVRERRPIDLHRLFESVGLHWLPPRADRGARLVELERPHPLYRTLFSPEESP